MFPYTDGGEVGYTCTIVKHVILLKEVDTSIYCYIWMYLPLYYFLDFLGISKYYLSERYSDA